MGCVSCGVEFKKEKRNDLEFQATVNDQDIHILGLTGYKCPECGETYFDLDASEKITAIVEKYRRTMGPYKRKITQSGHRKVIGIPQEIEEALKIRGGEEVNIYLKGNRILAEILR